MKRILYLFGVMLLTATVFTSCSDDDSDEGGNNSLVGQWRGISTRGWVKSNGVIIEEWTSEDVGFESDFIYAFTEDGEMRFYECDESGEWTWEGSTNYKYKDGKIFVVGDEDTGEVLAWEVKELTATTLILAQEYVEDYDGEECEFYDELTLKKVNEIDL